MNPQLALSFAPAPERMARRHDAQTSKQAAAAAVGIAASHEDVIYQAICNAPAGLIKDEIAALTGLTDIQVARRLSALEERGKIERPATRDGATVVSYVSRANARGRQCCVWRRVRAVEMPE